MGTPGLNNNGQKFESWTKHNLYLLHLHNIFLFLQVDALRFYQLQLFEDQDIKTQPQFNYAWQKNGFNMAKLMSTGSL